MQALAEKQDTNQVLRSLLADKEKIKSEGKLLYQILIEIMFTKFGTNQLEHVQRGIDKVKEVLLEMYGNNEEAQRVVLETLFKSFNVDSLSAQDFSKENLFQLRQKVNNIVVRLVQVGVISLNTATSFCLEQLLSYEGDILINSTHCFVILNLIFWSQSQRDHLVAKYSQDLDKVAEVRIETPYETRMRQQADEDGREWIQDEGFKEKTPD
jgi:hypothetical protein